VRDVLWSPIVWEFEPVAEIDKCVAEHERPVARYPQNEVDGLKAWERVYPERQRVTRAVAERRCQLDGFRVGGRGVQRELELQRVASVPGAGQHYCRFASKKQLIKPILGDYGVDQHQAIGERERVAGHLGSPQMPGHVVICGPFRMPRGPVP
jgi:hypothetical protein